MNEDPRLKPKEERVAVAAKRDRGPVLELRATESAPNAVTTSTRPTGLSPATDRDLVGKAESPARAILRSLALPRLKISLHLASFIGCVLVPAFAATVYFAFIASNQYAAEARFAVRALEADFGDPASDGSSESKGSSVNFSFTASGQNAYIVTSYVRSRAVVDDLNAKLDLREMFRRPEADFWARLNRDASIDELTEYWNSMVATYIDAPSGIVTLQVRAFRQDDALALGKAVMELSEMLVNRISDRARRDSMEMSEKEVRRTYTATQAALAELHRFRDSAGIIDPAQAAGEIGKLVVPLMAEKIRLESELFVASRDLDDSAPTIKALKSRLETTERQIAELKSKLTRTDGAGQTVSASLVKFEELELQRQSAEKLYSLAQADLDRARLRADRQSIYLTVFVPPSLPEESRYPRRIAFPILIFLGLTVVWSIVAMIVASVEDHRL
jgi:capsular polysaccharide transport system permease protein